MYFILILILTIDDFSAAYHPQRVDFKNWKTDECKEAYLLTTERNA